MPSTNADAAFMVIVLIAAGLGLVALPFVAYFMLAGT
jgi:hypothetical protein